MVQGEAYRRMSIQHSQLIAHARIPVLKLELRNGIELDVSLNDTGGIRAANFLQSWVSRGLLVVCSDCWSICAGTACCSCQLCTALVC